MLSYSTAVVQRNIITTVSSYSVILQCLAKVLHKVMSNEF